MDGKTLRHNRLLLGLSQQELGERLGATRHAIGPMERGVNRISPCVELAVRCLMYEDGLTRLVPRTGKKPALYDLPALLRDQAS